MTHPSTVLSTKNGDKRLFMHCHAVSGVRPSCTHEVRRPGPAAAAEGRRPQGRAAWRGAPGKAPCGGRFFGRRRPDGRHRPDGAGSGSAVPAPEFVDPARGVHDLLRTGVERMALRAHVEVKFAAQGGARPERVPTATGHGEIAILGMDVGFHVRTRTGPYRGARSLSRIPDRIETRSASSGSGLRVSARRSGISW